MNAKVLIIAVASVLLGSASAQADEPAKRPEWDQKKAVEKLNNMLAVEEEGKLPWDDIAWQTDPAKAAALAQKEQKPIFIYFFLKKNVGPAAAPC